MIIKDSIMTPRSIKKLIHWYIHDSEKTMYILMWIAIASLLLYPKGILIVLLWATLYIHQFILSCKVKDGPAYKEAIITLIFVSLFSLSLSAITLYWKIQ